MKTHSKALVKLVVKLNLGVTRKLSKMYVDLENSNLNILEVLTRNGLICGYKIENDKLAVFLKFNEDNTCIFKRIKVLPRTTKLYTKTNKNMFMYLMEKKFFGFYIISTNLGLFSSFEILALVGESKISGKLLLKIFF